MKRRNITDRAHRYRANSPQHRPLGPKVCAVKLANGKVCGSRRNVVPDHKNGNPSDTRRSNLRWACKSCNTREGKRLARLGKGRRTKQFNPGADNLAQYVQAGVDHVRGSHDAAGKVIHETPKGRRKAFAREIWNRRRASGNPKSHTKDSDCSVDPKTDLCRKCGVLHGDPCPDCGARAFHKKSCPALRNPKKRNYSSAEELYRKFHGRGPDKSYDVLIPVTDPYAEHPAVAQLGKLLSLYVGEGVKLAGSLGTVPKSIPEAEIEPWVRVIKFDEKQPDVAGEPGGTQIYFAGGNQDIDAMLEELGADPRKDLLDLGFCYRIEYMTSKKFDQFRPTDYWHLFGEDTGVQPRLLYDRAHKLLILAGGEYVIRPEGIVN